LRRPECTRGGGSLASLCTDYVKITEEAAALSAYASGTVGPSINDILHGSHSGVRVKDARSSWAMDAARDLLVSIAMSARHY